MNESALEFLLRYSDWIRDADFFSWAGHTVLWWIIRGLYRVAVFSEGLIDSMFALSAFLEDGAIGTVYSSIRILSVTILAITIIYMALKLMFNQKINIKGAVIRAILFGSLIVHLPAIINQGLAVSIATYEQTKNIGNVDNTTLSFSMVRDNIADLSYLARRDFAPLGSNDVTVSKNSLTETAFLNTRLTQILTPSDVRSLIDREGASERTEYLSYTIQANASGELYVERINNGWFSMFDEGKFRFSAQFGAILVGLGTLTVMFVFSAFIIGTSILELLFTKLLFPLLAVSDLETGERVKHMIIDIGKTFMQIMLTGLSLSIFRMYFSFISTMDLNIAAYALACIVGIKVCLDGSNAFGKFLGIDVGLQSGYKAMVGTAAAVSTAKNIGKGIGALGKGAVKTGKGAVDIAKEAPAKVQNGVEGFRNFGEKSIRNASNFVGHQNGQMAEMGLDGYMEYKANLLKENAVDGAKGIKDGIKDKGSQIRDKGSQFKNDVKAAYGSGKEDAIVKTVNDRAQKRAVPQQENNGESKAKIGSEQKESPSSLESYNSYNSPLNTDSSKSFGGYDEDIDIGKATNGNVPDIEIASFEWEPWDMDYRSSASDERAAEVFGWEDTTPKMSDEEAAKFFGWDNKDTDATSIAPNIAPNDKNDSSILSISEQRKEATGGTPGRIKNQSSEVTRDSGTQKQSPGKSGYTHSKVDVANQGTSSEVIPTLNQRNTKSAIDPNNSGTSRTQKQSPGKSEHMHSKVDMANRGTSSEVSPTLNQKNAKGEPSYQHTASPIKNDGQGTPAKETDESIRSLLQEVPPADE